MKLNHKVTIYRGSTADVDGIMTYSWNMVATNVRAFIDVAFLRPGIDPTWAPGAGREVDRSGVAFFPAGTNIQSGDRVTVDFGPPGQFEIRDTNEIWTPTRASHIEAGIGEVSKQLEI